MEPQARRNQNIESVKEMGIPDCDNVKKQKKSPRRKRYEKKYKSENSAKTQ